MAAQTCLKGDYFWENPDLKVLELDNCPGITKGGALKVRKLRIEIW